MNCKACRVEIEELDDAQPLSDVVRAHLESCNNCAAFHQQHWALKGMIGGLEFVTAPADFDFRLRARLAALKSDRRSMAVWSRLSPGTLSMAIAAAFVVVIVVGLGIIKPRPEPTKEIEQESIVKSEGVGVKSPSGPSVDQSQTEAGQKSGDASHGNLANLIASPSNRTTRRVTVKSPNSSTSEKRTLGDITSVDLGSTSTANSVLPPGIPDPMTLAGTTTAVPVRVSAQPTTILLTDSGAVPQNVSLRTVTFGAQEMIERKSAKKFLFPTVQGIW